VALEIIRREPEATARPMPLLFVHGAWHGAWCWDDYFLPYFAQHGYRVHALSLRGHGQSPNNKSLRLTSIGDYVADVAQVADDIAKQYGHRPAVIGHSMGGAVVQKYLEKYAAPAGVLLASMPPRGTFFTTLRVARRHPLAILKTNLQLRLWPIVETLELAHDAFFSADLPREQVQKHYVRLQDESYRAYMDMMLFQLPRPRRVKTPLLVLGGADDKIFSVGEVESTARAYQTQAQIFPNTAHDMMLEASWQKVADAILQWLNEY
jgi:pimeloyl-ACP methyl ester carboxylesterase